mmetsp:Transcript_36082/g.100145  ORF Transcript_36082/g.100145 Transcript_36082/m.100145 type:complete len:112 (+) Transcript_36082:540-875(+)
MSWPLALLVVSEKRLAPTVLDSSEPREVLESTEALLQGRSAASSRKDTLFSDSVARSVPDGLQSEKHTGGPPEAPAPVARRRKSAAAQRAGSCNPGATTITVNAWEAAPLQ